MCLAKHLHEHLVHVYYSSFKIGIYSVYYIVCKVKFKIVNEIEDRIA